MVQTIPYKSNSLREKMQWLKCKFGGPGTLCGLWGPYQKVVILGQSHLKTRRHKVIASYCKVSEYGYSLQCDSS